MTRPDFLATVILAAGKGTRMKSARAKVLHEVFYRPMLHHVLAAVAPLRSRRSIVIVGHQKEVVYDSLAGCSGVVCVEQEEQRGTGHAVLCAESSLADFDGEVMILCGDAPLLLPEHLQEMHRRHRQGGTPLTIMTTVLKDPANYGRIVTDSAGGVRSIVEEKDATPEQRRITEINAGIYCVEKRFLFEALKQVTTDNSQGEMYLTDIVAIAVSQGIGVARYEHPHPHHVLGVNSRVELAQAHAELQARRNRELMSAGITMHNPPTVAVAPTATVAADCILTAQITITGSSSLGAGCIIDPGVCLHDAEIGSDVHIGANSIVTGCRIDAGTTLAPLSRIEGEAAV